jgi:putative tryptophan/tyrosine transport system substrate-binding protein
VRRRDFIAAFGGAAAWPLVADAQWPSLAVAQISSKRPLIAWLSLGRQPSSSVYVDAFLQGLRERGYEEGRNFDIVYRFADGYIERLPALTKEVVRLPPNVILAAATAPAVAAKKVTSTIPIVSPALADAIHLGLIASDSRPGGNVTGIAPYVGGLPAKQLELAREVVAGAAKVGVLTNLDDPKAPAQWKELEAAGQKLGVNVIAAEARTPDDLDAAFQTLGRQGVDVIIVLQTSMLVTERQRIAALATKAQLPAIYGYREHVDDGGLISYGVDLRECFRRSGYLVDKILKGAAPSDLPVEFPTKLELVINLKTAKALGLEIPPTLLARADEVIE